MNTCASKTAVAARGVVECFDGFPLDAFITGYDHLGDALAVLNGLDFIRKVDEDAFDFTAVITVDGSRCVCQADAAFDGQSAAWTNLGFKTIGEFDEQPGRDERTAKWWQGNRMAEVGAKVHACAARSFVLWQLKGRLVDDSDVQGRIIFAQK